MVLPLCFSPFFFLLNFLILLSIMLVTEMYITLSDCILIYKKSVTDVAAFSSITIFADMTVPIVDVTYFAFVVFRTWLTILPIVIYWTTYKIKCLHFFTCVVLDNIVKPMIKFYAKQNAFNFPSSTFVTNITNFVTNVTNFLHFLSVLLNLPADPISKNLLYIQYSTTYAGSGIHQMCILKTFKKLSANP
jgi:hypothetical protein